jgi:hypothetical protein
MEARMYTKPRIQKYTKKYPTNMSLQLHYCDRTSVDTEMCCPKGKCGCQYFILLTLKEKKIMDTYTFVYEA